MPIYLPIRELPHPRHSNRQNSFWSFIGHNQSMNKIFTQIVFRIFELLLEENFQKSSGRLGEWKVPKVKKSWKVKVVPFVRFQIRISNLKCSEMFATEFQSKVEWQRCYCQDDQTWRFMLYSGHLVWDETTLGMHRLTRCSPMWITLLWWASKIDFRRMAVAPN